MWSSIKLLPNQVSKNRSIRLKILTYESPMRRYIAKLWELIQFEGLKSVSTVFLGTLTDFLCILHGVRLHK